MSWKAAHAFLTLVVGLAVGIVWLRAFWSAPRRAPVSVLAAPIAVALLGLNHWVAYDFSLAHWPGGFSLAQAAFNFFVFAALMLRRSEAATAAA